jgi:hypothetical protein
MSYYDMINPARFDSHGNCLGHGYNANHSCINCGSKEDLKELSGPGCWYILCGICRQEKEEVEAVVSKYDKLREKRRRNK